MQEIERVSAVQAASELATGRIVLVDVREPEELAIAAVAGAIHIPLGRLQDRLDEIPRDANVVMMCHAGVRSAMACRIALAAGFERVRNLEGGIDAWSTTVDPAVPRY